jgi:hypothetical protein
LGTATYWSSFVGKDKFTGYGGAAMSGYPFELIEKDGKRAVKIFSPFLAAGDKQKEHCVLHYSLDGGKLTISFPLQQWPMRTAAPICFKRRAE